MQTLKKCGISTGSSRFAKVPVGPDLELNCLTLRKEFFEKVDFEKISRRQKTVKGDLNSVQKFCCNGFSKFLLLYIILGPTSL